MRKSKLSFTVVLYDPCEPKGKVAQWYHRLLLLPLKKETFTGFFRVTKYKVFRGKKYLFSRKQIPPQYETNRICTRFKNPDCIKAIATETFLSKHG